jgi:hypothetical protein
MSTQKPPTRARSKRRARRIDEAMQKEQLQRPDCELKLISSMYTEIGDEWIAYVFYSYEGEPLELGGGGKIDRKGHRWSVYTGTGGGSAGELEVRREVVS